MSGCQVWLAEGKSITVRGYPIQSLVTGYMTLLISTEFSVGCLILSTYSHFLGLGYKCLRMVLVIQGYFFICSIFFLLIAKEGSKQSQKQKKSREVKEVLENCQCNSVLSQMRQFFRRHSSDLTKFTLAKVVPLVQGRTKRHTGLTSFKNFFCCCYQNLFLGNDFTLATPLHSRIFCNIFSIQYVETY